MKVALTVEVTDDQRRALANGKLATRADVRAYIEGALGQLGALTPIESAAHTPTARAPLAPSTPSDWPAALKKKVAERRGEGWNEDQLAMYVKGWFYQARST